ncbi:MAG: gamma-glutamyltransferase family protein, partial [Burkholderiales bacterium]
MTNIDPTIHGSLERRRFLAGLAATTGAFGFGLSGASLAQPAPNVSKLATSTKGMVTSPHTLATEAGLKVLSDGGNAMEAAIAMGAVIAVTYPHFSGIGGDGVWIVADSEGRQTTLLGIGQAAANTGGYSGEVPLRGPRSTITSACTVDTWNRAHEFSRKYWGGERSFGSLLDTAIDYAENGFPTTYSQVFWQEFRKKEAASWPGFEKLFMPGGTAPKIGDKFIQADLARSLKLIAKNGPRDFYEGELAARIAKGLQEAGSPLTALDLKKTVTKQAKPESIDYRGVTLLAPPVPTQGITTLSIMGVLREFDLSKIPEGSADYYHLCVEAVKQAFLDRPRIADPDFVPQPVNEWLALDRLAAKAASIDMRAALPWPQVFKTGDTVYIGATDSQGRSVSLLQSVYFDWGSGVVVGDTGILWQNRGAGFSLDPKSPNVLAPGKRPFYTLTPGLALKNGKPYVLYGTQGADGQPQTLSVVLTRILDYGMNPLQALSKPRFVLGKSFFDARATLRLERDAGAEVVAELTRRGHEMTPIDANSPLGGQAGAIVIHSDGRI